MGRGTHIQDFDVVISMFSESIEYRHIQSLQYAQYSGSIWDVQAIFSHQEKKSILKSFGYVVCYGDGDVLGIMPSGMSTVTYWATCMALSDVRILRAWSVLRLRHEFVP